MAEGGGRPGVNGPYAQFGEHNAAPQYYRIDGSGNKLEGVREVKLSWFGRYINKDDGMGHRS